MIYRTYEEVRRKIERDLDIEEELFITPAELQGLYNEALDEAEATIMSLNEDYFLTMAPVMLRSGRAVYSLPDNIYANKIRSIRYQNGSNIYEVPRLRDHRKFQDIDNLNFAPPSPAEYVYYLRNDSAAGGVKMILIPGPQEDSGTTVSITIANPSIFSTVAAHGLSAGQEICLVTTDELPDGFVDGGLYVVASVPSSTTFTLALTPEGNPLEGTGSQSGTHKFEVAPFRMTLWYIRNALRVSDDSDLVDIPEFVNFLMQHVKVRVYEKEGHPNLEKAVADLERERKLMVSTLTQMVPDNNDLIPMDMSHYEDHL